MKSDLLDKIKADASFTASIKEIAPLLLTLLWTEIPMIRFASPHHYRLAFRVFGLPTPAVLSARLGWAQGLVFHENPGKEPFAPAEADLELPTLRGPDGQPLSRARVRGRIPAGSSGSLRVRFAEDPHAAPGVQRGRYEAQLAVAGCPLTVVVLS